MPTDADKIKELEDRVRSLEKSNLYLQNKVQDFEDGESSLYHAVKRKMTELSRVLNKHKLDEVDIDDKNSKTFDRISAIIEKCEKYALSANALGSRLGIRNDEQPDMTKSLYKKPITSETMADAIGELAGHR